MRQVLAAVTNEPRKGGNWCATCEILSVIVKFDRDGFKYWGAGSLLARLSVLIVSAAIAFVASSGQPAADHLSESDVLWTQKVLRAIDASNWTMARKFAKRVKAPLAANLLTWARLTSASPKVSFDQVAAFIKQNPDWPGQVRLRHRAEEAMKPDMPADQVLVWFADHPPLSADGMTRLGAALLASGEAANGREVLREAWIAGNFTKVRERVFYKNFRQVQINLCLVL